MIIEGEYFYKGAMRLSWGFGSPNQLGALLASALPVIWGLAPGGTPLLVQGARPNEKPWGFSWPEPIKAACWVIELCLWLMIGATGSRGAAVAGLGAALAWAILSIRSERTPSKVYAGWFVLRIGLCLVGFLAFSFGGRVSPEFLMRDGSIWNRFTLWSGGATLIAASPWSGWGVGESGNAFMQWVQPLDRAEAYRTMVNGFLHVGVERGLPVFGVLCFLTIMSTSWAYVCEALVVAQKIKRLVRASSCVLLSWAISNVFSTLFKDWRLWVFPCMALLFLLGSLVVTRVSRGKYLRWISYAAALSIFTSAGVYILGNQYNSRYGIRLTRPHKEAVVLESGTHAGELNWGMLVDEVVLGKRYGHELRRWAIEAAYSRTPWSVVVFDSRRSWADSSLANKMTSWILMGETASDADFLGSEKFVIFMHPCGELPRRWRGSGTVIFNEVDEDGSRERWIQWAAENKLRIVTVPAVGMDARFAWPTGYTAHLESPH